MDTMMNKSGLLEFSVVFAIIRIFSLALRSNFCKFLVCLLWVLLPFHSSFAVDLDIRGSRQNHLDVSLIFQNASADLKDGNTLLKTDFTRVGVAVYDIAPESRIDAGLLLGYAFADHPDQDISQGLETDGAYIGISIRAFLRRQDPLNVALLFHYMYQDSNASAESESLSLESAGGTSPAPTR